MKTTTPEKKLAEKIIEEIHRSWGTNRFSSFEELNDICDANMLGDAESVLEEHGMEKGMDIINAAQNIVNEELKNQ